MLRKLEHQRSNTGTIADNQIDALVTILVDLVKNYGGDGVDFDWEHASDAGVGTDLRTWHSNITPIKYHHKYTQTTNR